MNKLSVTKICSRALWLTALMCVIGGWSASMAQTGKALVSGRVTDKSAAVVPGATVAVTNVDTGIIRQVQTNMDGYYTVTLLDPGNYTIRVTASGFAASLRSGLKFDVEQAARLDFELTVGQVTEVLEISAAAPLLDSQTSAVGQVVENRSIVEMPLNGRNAWNLVTLAGGATLLGVRGDSDRIPVVSIAGGRSYSQSFVVDGGSFERSGLTRNVANLAPMVDSLEEFKVVSSNYSAEYGRSAGGVFTAVTKSGTNQFHGTVFEFLRNDAFDARNFFSVTKPPLRYNQYGATVGGPIIKNKTHFFFGYEGTNTATGIPLIATMPKPEFLAGDFSGLRNNNGAAIPIYDPATTRPHPTDPTRSVRDLFPGSRIPRSVMDPVALAAAAFYPAPNAAGTVSGANNFIINLAPKRNTDNYTIRIDHELTSRDRIYARYIGETNFLPSEAAYPEPAASPLGPNARTVADFADGATASWTRIFSPSVISDFKLSRTTNSRELYHESLDGDWPAKLGFRGVDPQMFPGFRPQGYAPVGAAVAAFRDSRAPAWMGTQSISIFRGNHQIKAGFELRWNGSVDFFPRNRSGDFTFDRQGTGLQGVAASGDGFASFLLGFNTRAQIRDSTPLPYSSSYYGWYLQDDWKVTPRLTLNLGIRHDIETGRISPQDVSSGFDFVQIHPVARVPGVVTFAGRNGEPRRPFDTDLNNLGPRFGFAYNLGKTVVRGGYGIFFANVDGLGGAAGVRAAVGFINELDLLSPDQNQTPVFLLRNGFPSIQTTPPVLDAACCMGLPIEYWERYRPTPYSQQFNLSVQREVLGGVLAELQYLGNLGHHLTGIEISANQVRPEMVGLPGTIQSRRPFPHFSDVLQLSPNFGNSTYHALVVRAERRYQNGLQFLFNHTYQSFIDDVDGIADDGDFGGTPSYQDYYNRKADRAISALDRRHSTVFNTIWDLPFGKGRRWMQQGFPSYVIGGWQLSALGTILSGPVFGVTAQSNTCECFSAGLLRADILRNPALPETERSIHEWFDTSAFAQPRRFALGNGARSVGRAPGRTNFDLGIHKNFIFAERFRLQFRAEMFNAFNRANFGLPNTSLGSATFGIINSAAPARVLQLGLKLYY